MRGRALVIASCVFALLALAPSPAAAQAEQPYNTSDGNVSHGNWTDGHEDVTVENVSHYVSRVGTFVVGEDPDDPGAGPIVTGLIVGLVAVSAMGTSRSGLVASGTMAVVVAGVLSTQAMMLPKWLYGAILLLISLVAGILYVRSLR